MTDTNPNDLYPDEEPYSFEFGIFVGAVLALLIFLGLVLDWSWL